MYKSQCPTVEQWVQYLLGEFEDTRNQLELHLQECSYCRFVLARLRQEMARLTMVWNDSTQPDVIKLHAWHLGNLGEVHPHSLLAAQSEDDSTMAESVTLSSADQRLLLRAVRDPRTREVWLYLVAEDPSVYQNALVRPFNLRQEFLADSEGRINLGAIDWPDKTALNAEVHLPKVSFRLAPLEDVASKENSVELTSAHGERIRVTFSGEGRNRRLTISVLDIPGLGSEQAVRVAVRAGAETRLVHLPATASSPAAFDNVDVLKTIEVFLYH
jgi:hypothetical protein